jgi:actin-related protein
MESTESNQIVVVDIGSSTVKAGFSGEEFPRITIPNTVGTPRDNNIIVPGIDYKDYYLGDEAYQMRSIINLSYPI